MESRGSWKIVCNYVVAFYLIAFLATQSYAKKYKVKKVKLPNNLEDIKIFSDEEIAKFDGSDENLPLYMAVKGVVFDVSSGSRFYGKGKSYNALIGKDSTRAVAKMSLEPEDLNANISDLDDNLLEALDDVYQSTYVEKYPVAGYMDYLVAKHKKYKSKEDL